MEGGARGGQLMVIGVCGVCNLGAEQKGQGARV